MNTVKSFWLGWGSLVVAGGGAYYFAKRSINADRQARLEDARKRKNLNAESLEYSPDVPSRPISSATMGGGGHGSGAVGTVGTADPHGHRMSARTDSAASPSQEASGDPAPTRHAPATEGQRVGEKSKYESAVPFRSPRGDRFS